MNKIKFLQNSLARSPDNTINISFFKGKFGFGGFDINKIDTNGKIEIFLVKGAPVVIKKEERKKFFETLVVNQRIKPKNADRRKK